ncbi:catalase [Pseudoxanthomonas dokdonensis]|uniref:Catalase n=1 Tax=Pseudoxanthomonas dokdonensis TaxID=344882 RepID=A0A0R0CFD8_9GAMM|nr:catalase [Pseudoxanthomonas dokdonensis]KRG68032.1 catalase [Pseudoxanthomonas dokdonensis]
MASNRKSSPDQAAIAAMAAARNTDSGPAGEPPAVESDAAAMKMHDTARTAAAFPHNAAKPSEHGEDSRQPATGQHQAMSLGAAASSLSENNDSGKSGEPARDGCNPTVGAMDRVRVDSAGRPLTTNQGVQVADNQNSLKAGLRGPALLKDFILREKITHFDHERIPERVVHARGSAAHGYFEAYDSFAHLTCAAPLQQKGKRTPVFVRFSTVAGERGSKDTARDVRGFAVKFYTEDGNWDLVGNNMPVFFIQDAMKFPDLIHAVKPEPHHAMPQAASAHDTFWDFVSLMPESTHMLMWLMSDRAIPRSYRMMQGFGVHTFRLVNAQGESVLVKFHWTPLQGVHSLTWDEAVKISGADPDFHRRDLWEAIEAGQYPVWELGLQVFSDADAEAFSFDVLDATKLVPEELVPIVPVGRMVLDRNPDNFFAETEQVAFCTAHVVPGIDFTNDPLLAGRIHSYVDTQITRLGGPNFHEIPINAPMAQVHNNQRDGMHRQAVNRGRVAYEPNSLGGGCPFQAGSAGFTSFPEPVAGEERRGKPEKFAEHYAQARLFYQSQSAIEQAHIAAAFRFELSKVTVPAIRRRTLSLLASVADDLAQQVADGLGMPVPEALPPLPMAAECAPEITESPALSQLGMPGEVGIASRKIAILIADGVNGETVSVLQKALLDAGAVPRLVGQRLGVVNSQGTAVLDADASLENSPAVLFDGAVVADGSLAQTLASDGRAAEFLKDQFRHCKTLLAVGEGASLLEGAGILRDADDAGLLIVDECDDRAIESFIEALARHRHFERERDPPPV